VGDPVPFVIALCLSVLATPLAGRLSRALGLVDRPGLDGLKIHSSPVPILGGLGAIIAGFVALGLTGWRLSGAVVGALVVAFATGLADDVKPRPVPVRLALQAGAGLLVAGQLEIGVLGWASVLCVPVIAIACINAVNIVDGQDGLAGGLGAVAAVGFWLLLGDDAYSSVGLAFAGALAGFLVWNRPPARIFLGNGGAYLVGVVLAVLSVRLASIEGWLGLLVAGTCLGPFAFEFVFTFMRRLFARERIVFGDRLHSYDILSLQLKNRNASTAVFCLLGGLSSTLAVLLRSLSLATAALIAFSASAAALVWAVSLFKHGRVSLAKARTQRVETDAHSEALRR
jgi:UDP-GlcNAc:undecaprenyl-phosphate GlcNAc-1-phosphate transferase